jgi:hypothetical protein
VNRVSNELSDFYGDEQVQVVVISNFLHEIAPQEWQTHFQRASKVLSDEGVVVVMEDQEPPVGELPTRNGLILLDLPSMRTLFGENTNVRPLVKDMRLTAFEIPKSLLCAVTRESLRAALLETEARAKEELKLIRGGNAVGSPQAQRPAEPQ